MKPSLRSVGAFAALAMSGLTACGGTVASERTGGGSHGGRESGSGDEGRDDAGSGDEHHYPGGAGNALEGSGGTTSDTRDASLEPPPELKQKATTWIGQTERPVTYPPSDAVSGPQKVVLILRAVADANAVGGTITFGSGRPPPKPTGPDAPYPPNGGFSPESLLLAPYDGFSYTLVFSDLKENHLTLTYNPSELFREWCAMKTPRPGGYDINLQLICECSETECHHLAGPIERIDFVVTGDSIQGELGQVSSDSPLPTQVRMQRVE
jgi:hypothetical protein